MNPLWQNNSNIATDNWTNYSSNIKNAFEVLNGQYGQVVTVINDDNNPGMLKETEDDSISIGTGKGTLKILKASYKNKHELGEIFSTKDVGVKLGL